MKIYIDIGHPAQVYFWHNFIILMKRKNHNFFITAREKDITLDLLNAFGTEHTNRGHGAKTQVGRVLYAFGFLFKYFRIIKEFNPDICVSKSSPYSVLISWLLRKPSIVFEDTETARGFFWIYNCFASVVLTPSCFGANFGTKQLKVNSYKEFAYLHKNYLNLPIESPEIKSKKVLFRFVSHNVNHDKEGDGLTLDMKIRLIKDISAMAEVFVSSEKGLDLQFPEQEIKISPVNIHKLLASCQLLIGESATMATEASVLGVPAIFFDKHRLGNMEELEYKYKLINNYSTSQSSVEKAINKASEILNTLDYVQSFTAHDKLLQDKIDITAFLIWFVENFPDSYNTMLSNPDYQNRFK